VTYHSHVLLVFFTCDATVTTTEPVHNDITKHKRKVTPIITTRTELKVLLVSVWPS